MKNDTGCINVRITISNVTCSVFIGQVHVFSGRREIDNKTEYEATYILIAKGVDV